MSVNNILWIDYGVGNAYVINNYTLQNRADTKNYAPRKWYFIGTNDNTSSWTVLDDRTGTDNPQGVAGQTFVFTFSNSNAYRWYGYRVNSLYNGGLGLAEFNLFTDGVSPVASFTITLTDTSIGPPSSWQWNATNLLGNNTPVTISTDQNPILTLTQGNWLIDLIATNDLGSDTCNSTIGINLTSPTVYFWSRTS